MKLRHPFLSLLILLALGSMFLFYDHYWRYRHLFGADGKYFDPGQGVVFHSHSGMIWGSLSVLLLLLVLVLGFIKR